MRAAGVRLLAGLAVVAVLSGTVDEPLRAAEAVFPAADQLNAEALTFEFIDKAIAEGRLKSAGDLILRADKRFPGPELMLRQAELMLAAGSFAEAATAFQKLEADPVVGVRAMVGRGITAIRAGHPEAAEALLADAVGRDPSQARAWSARAVLADRRHDWASAERFYAAALKAAPDAEPGAGEGTGAAAVEGAGAAAEEPTKRAA